MRQFSESAPQQSAISFRSWQFSRVDQNRIAGCSAILCLYPPHSDTVVTWLMKHPAGAPASYKYLDFIVKHFGVIDNRNSMIAANAKQARESEK
jgi:hypothetical protein